MTSMSCENDGCRMIEKGAENAEKAWKTPRARKCFAQRCAYEVLDNTSDTIPKK